MSNVGVSGHGNWPCESLHKVNDKILKSSSFSFHCWILRLLYHSFCTTLPHFRTHKNRSQPSYTPSFVGPSFPPKKFALIPPHTMAALRLFNLLALASVAILAITSGPTSVSALAIDDRSNVARFARVHDAVAKKKRDSTTSSSGNGRCKPRATTTSSTFSSPTVDSYTTPTSYTSPTPSIASSSTYYTPSTTSSTSTTTTPASTPTTNSNGKKWGLGWPNGDSSYLSNFASLPNVGLYAPFRFVASCF